MVPISLEIAKIVQPIKKKEEEEEASIKIDGETWMMDLPQHPIGQSHTKGSY